jgi:hypothetical protein
MKVRLTCETWIIMEDVHPEDYEASSPQELADELRNFHALEPWYICNNTEGYVVSAVVEE